MDRPYTRDNYSLDQSVGYLLCRARVLLAANFDQALADFDMTHAQYGIFRMLLDSTGGMTAGELARAWEYDTGAMTRLLDRLEDKGFICRSRRPSDRRVVEVRLSEKGRALADHMSLAAIDALNHHLRGFSLAEVEQLKDFLRRMIANA